MLLQVLNQCNEAMMQRIAKYTAFEYRNLCQGYNLLAMLNAAALHYIQLNIILTCKVENIRAVRMVFLRLIGFDN